MDCIFLNCPNSEIHFCHAQLIRPCEDIQFYKPSEIELKNYCKNENDFCDCPRYDAFKSLIKH